MVSRNPGLLVLLLWAASVAADEPDPELARVYYEFEVAGYCGLVDEQVGQGFRKQRDRVMARNDIDDAGMQQARMRGWRDANLEWQNRGLGGFKGWCRGEGAEVAERFSAFGSM